MKKISLIILILISTITFSQEFEGIIEYKTSFEKLSKNNPVNIKQLELILSVKFFS